MDHDWRMTSDDDPWEMAFCEDRNCALPRNSAKNHIRCEGCKESPPMVTFEEDDGLYNKSNEPQTWFYFHGDPRELSVDGPCMNPHHDLMIEILKAEEGE